jgi:DNA-binding FadR family transcriptional regulator
MRHNKADLVADVLRHEIAVGIYPAGSELPSEGRLSARFGVSRPSSREALRVLESEGLIRVARGARGGAKVLLPSLDAISRYLGIYLQMRQVRVSDLYGALLAYEPLAARSIAQRRDPAALSALAACVAAQQFSTHDREEYRKHEREFRHLLLAHSGNEVIRLMGSLLTEVYEKSLASITRDIGSVVWEVEHLTSGVVAKQRLMKLMADGEEEQAARAWKAYLFTYWRRVRSHVGQDVPIKFYSEHTPPPPPSISARRAEPAEDETAG